MINWETIGFTFIDPMRASIAMPMMKKLFRNYVKLLESNVSLSRAATSRHFASHLLSVVKLFQNTNPLWWWRIVGSSLTVSHISPSISIAISRWKITLHAAKMMFNRFLKAFAVGNDRISGSTFLLRLKSSGLTFYAKAHILPQGWKNND